MPRTPRRGWGKASTPAAKLEQNSQSHPYKRVKTEEASSSAAVQQPNSEASGSGHPSAKPNNIPASLRDETPLSSSKQSKRRQKKKHRERNDKTLSATPVATAETTPIPTIETRADKTKKDKRSKRKHRIEASEDKNVKPDVKPDIEQDVRPDIVPDPQLDVQPDVQADVKFESEPTPEAAPVNPQSESETVKELKRMHAAAQLALQQESEALKKRVGELQKDLDASKAEAETRRQFARATETVLQGHDSKIAEMTEALSCGVCFEPLSDPHVLACGHAACRDCLLQWFKSQNAYPSEEITETENVDLTYRTKVCHICREPVFRRPTRIFAFQTVIDLIRKGEQTESGITTPAEDIWANIFPPEPKQWLVQDVDDGVSRCPRCGCEVAYGQCINCAAVFSPRREDGDDTTDLEGIDLGYGGFGIETDEEPEVVWSPQSEERDDEDDDASSLLASSEDNATGHAELEAMRQARDRRRHYLGSDDDSDPASLEQTAARRDARRRRRGSSEAYMNRLGNMLDDMAEEDSDVAYSSSSGGDSVDEANRSLRRDPYGSDFERYTGPRPRPGRPLNEADYPPAEEGYLSDPEENWNRMERERSRYAAYRGWPSRRLIPYSEMGDHIMRREQADAEQEMGAEPDTDEDGYESSFIDDDGGHEVHEVQSSDDADSDIEEMVEMDGPTVAQLRALRAARYVRTARADRYDSTPPSSPPPTSPPRPSRQSRGYTSSPDRWHSSNPPSSPEPAPRRSTRATRIVISDSDEE